MIANDNDLGLSELGYTSKIQWLTVNHQFFSFIRKKRFGDFLILTRYSTKKRRWFGTMWPFVSLSFWWLRISLFSTLLEWIFPIDFHMGAAIKNYANSQK